MIKYKVKDIANDLGVQNKKITEILEKYCGVTKKTMMSLTESEIDVIRTLTSISRRATRSSTSPSPRRRLPRQRARLTLRTRRPTSPRKRLRISLHSQSSASARSSTPVRRT